MIWVRLINLIMDEHRRWLTFSAGDSYGGGGGTEENKFLCRPTKCCQLPPPHKLWPWLVATSLPPRDFLTYILGEGEMAPQSPRFPHHPHVPFSQKYQAVIFNGTQWLTFFYLFNFVILFTGRLLVDMVIFDVWGIAWHQAPFSSTYILLTAQKMGRGDSTSQDYPFCSRKITS